MMSVDASTVLLDTSARELTAESSIRGGGVSPVMQKGPVAVENGPFWAVEDFPP